MQGRLIPREHICRGHLFGVGKDTGPQGNGISGVGDTHEVSVHDPVLDEASDLHSACHLIFDSEDLCPVDRG